jgi:hypothetical protein
MVKTVKLWERDLDMQYDPKDDPGLCVETPIRL